MLGLLDVHGSFVHQRIENLADFRLGQLGAIAVAFIAGRAQALDVIVQRGFDIEQGPGDVEQGAFIRLAAALRNLLDGGALLGDHAPRHAESKHAQGVADPIQQLDLAQQVGRITLLRTQVDVQRFLDAHEVVLDRHGNRVEQGAVVSGDRALGVFDFTIGRQQRIQAVGVANRGNPFALAARMCNVVKEILHQHVWGHDLHADLTLLSKAPDLAIDSAKQQLHRGTRLQAAIADRVGNTGRHPEQAPRLFAGGNGLPQAIEDIAQSRRMLRIAGITKPFEQGRLEGQAQAQRETAQFLQRQFGGQASGRFRQGNGQVRRKQGGVGEQLFAATCAQVIQQRQEDDWNVLVTGLHALEIVRQLDHAAHQHGIAFITLGDGAGKQGVGKALHLFDEHGRAIQLDHAQGALRLMQIGRTKAHEAGIGRLVDIGLEGLTCLLEGLVELALDPAQRCEIIVQFHDFVSSWRSLPTLPQLTGLPVNPPRRTPPTCAVGRSSSAVNWLPPRPFQLHGAAQSSSGSGAAIADV